MAVCHHVPDGNRSLSQPYPPMVVPFNPCGGATPATPAVSISPLSQRNPPSRTALPSRPIGLGWAGLVQALELVREPVQRRDIDPIG